MLANFRHSYTKILEHFYIPVIYIVYIHLIWFIHKTLTFKNSNMFWIQLLKIKIIFVAQVPSGVNPKKL
jgi:uncharacterized membrane protein